MTLSVLKNLDFEGFSESITEQFMKSKQDDWVIDFYRELINYKSLYLESTRYSQSVLRKKPIIRLKKDQHCPPFDSSGKIQVFLPSKTKSPYKTVKSSIAKNEIVFII